MNDWTSPVDIRPDHLEMVQDILRERLPAEFRVWMFGSRANWTTKDSSDLDLAVEGAGRLDYKAMVGLEVAFEESDLPYTVDVVDLNAVSQEFREIVEGQRVALPVEQNGADVGAWRQTVYGKFPNHFRADKLVNLCILGNGIQTGPFGSQLHQRDYVSEGTPIITVEHLGQNRITTQDLPRVSDYDHIRLSKYTLQEGDVVFSRVGSVGRRALVRKGEEGWLFSGRCLRVRPDPSKIDAGYISYFFGLDSFQEYIRAIAVGATMPSLNTQILSDVPILCPPLPEQRAIAHILGTLDDKIELNRRMNQTLEEMSRAIFQDWFVDFGPVRAKLEGREPYLPPELWALFPDRLVGSELGEVPEGWGVSGLDEIADYRNGLALQKFRPQGNEGRLPVVKIAQLRSGRPDGAEWAKATIPSDCIIDDGDVIFSWSGSPMVKIWCSGRAALNQHLFKVTSREYPKWFYLRCIEAHLSDFQDIAADKATTMGHIKREHLSDAKCVVPNQTILVAADETFATLLSQQISINLQSRALAAQRDVLLPKLVSGEVSV